MIKEELINDLKDLDDASGPEGLGLDVLYQGSIEGPIVNFGDCKLICNNLDDRMEISEIIEALEDMPEGAEIEVGLEDIGEDCEIIVVVDDLEDGHYLEVE